MFDSSYKLVNHGRYQAHSFFCMGGLCEILVENQNLDHSRSIFKIAYDEAKRIEQKFSRYEPKNIIYKINNAGGKKVSLDKETAKLIHYSDQIYRVSDGLFDITSGVLRKVWRFDQSENTPSKTEVESLLSAVGWDKVKLEKKTIAMPSNFEIDLGGVGKEYAVDRCVALIKLKHKTSVLVNLGGDIAVTGPKSDGSPWVINVDGASKNYQLMSGAVATSGDKNKFLIKDGKKLSHILNPKTGWPLENAPSAITVIADTCTAAGSLSTLAMLAAPKHREFLESEAEDFFILV
ncbi:MAG: FAD:protein FMN transferase [Bdellovibrionales bacterium]